MRELSRILLATDLEGATDATVSTTISLAMSPKVEAERLEAMQLAAAWLTSSIKRGNYPR